MVKRAEFERALILEVNKAKDTIEKKFNLKINIQMDWTLGKGYHFDDETPSTGGIGG